jgi:uncharacterized DUF497 family protein
VKKFVWDQDKNTELISTRNISFKDIIECILNDKLLDVLINPNSKKYSKQKLFIVEFNNYAYVIPFVETEKEIFLKTIFPSRKYTKFYIKEK